MKRLIQYIQTKKIQYRYIVGIMSVLFIFFLFSAIYGIIKNLGYIKSYQQSMDEVQSIVTIDDFLERYTSGSMLGSYFDSENPLVVLSYDIISSYKQFLETNDLVTKYNTLMYFGSTLNRIRDQMLLASNTKEYDQLAISYQSSFDLYVQMKVAVCYAGLQDAIAMSMSLTKQMDTIVSQYNTLQTSYLNRYLQEKDEKTRACVTDVLHHVKGTARYVQGLAGAYQEQSTQLQEEYNTKVEEPGLCIQTDDLIVTPIVGSGLDLIIQQFIALQSIVDARDVPSLLSMCEQQQSDDMQSQADTVKQELESTLDQMKDLASSGSEPVELQQSEQATGQPGDQEPNQDDGDMETNVFSQYEEELIDSIKEKSSERYDRVQYMLQDPNYSSQNEIDGTFRFFEGFLEDFGQSREKQKEQSIGK